MSFSHSEAFTCGYCKKVFIFRVHDMKLTRSISTAKTLWNDFVSDHYIGCSTDRAISQANDINHKVCKFLNMMGVDARVKEGL